MNNILNIRDPNPTISAVTFKRTPDGPTSSVIKKQQINTMNNANILTTTDGAYLNGLNKIGNNSYILGNLNDHQVETLLTNDGKEVRIPKISQFMQYKQILNNKIPDSFYRFKSIRAKNRKNKIIQYEIPFIRRNSEKLYRNM